MIALVVDSALRTLLVAAAAGAVVRALRVRNPYALKTLWTTVLGAGLLMPLLLDCRIVPAPISSAVLSTVSIAGPIASVPATSRHAIESLYAAVSLVLLGRLALGIGRMMRVRRRATQLERCPDIRASASLASPVTFGSTILLPSDCLGWPEAKRAAVLVHERSHVEQRDSYVRWLALLHAAVFWFSPLAWWLSRRLTALAEQTSDEAVLREGIDRVAYASVLLDFARRARSRVQPAAAMAGGGVAQRIERIVSGAPINYRIPPWKRRALIGLAVAAAAMAASLWRPSMAQPCVTPPGAAQPSAASPSVAPPSSYRTAAADGGALRSARASSGRPRVVSWGGLERYYPREARRKGIEGLVRVAVTLDGAGRPVGVRVLSERPAGYGFGAAASMAADTALRYRNPTSRETRLIVNVKFALHH